MGDLSFRVRGSYLESCNCEAICPCRSINGMPGGRSTYGECFGLLTWRIEDGRSGGVDLSNLNVAMTIRYSDDEPGSPWTLTLHVDARGSEEQREALRAVFLDGLAQLPWVRKARHILAVEASEIEIEPGAARVGSAIRLRATRRVETGDVVSCGIPGHDRVGHELYADELVLADAELHGNCAYASDFDYASA